MTRPEFHSFICSLHPSDRQVLEREARRLTRLDNPRADALHLRISDGIDFDCRADLEDQAGPLARAAWSYCGKPVLLRHVERAMQLRSYREHRTVYEAHDLHSPVPVSANMIDLDALANTITEKLNLKDGCVIECTELADTEHSSREVMLAITTGGALANQTTFDAKKGVDFIEYRPAHELIIVYKPDIGRIEVCGRDWADRKAAVVVFASNVLGEELSERPLRQRNYDLRPFAQNLTPEIPETLADRITELCVTEARFALGDYDRKITVTAQPGEEIDKIVKRVLAGLGSSFGRPFICDVELFLRCSVPDRGEQKMRFKISNHNRSDLQSNLAPEDRELGFELLMALGVVSIAEAPSKSDIAELLDTLLDLLGHEQDRIGSQELREINADVSRLTRLSFLKQRTIASTVLIEDDEIGPYDAHVRPDPGRGTAILGLDPDDVQLQQDLESLLSWTVNRGFVREELVKTLRPLELSSRPEPLEHGLTALGDGVIAGETHPVYLWESFGNIDKLEKVIRSLRSQSHQSLVLAPGTPRVGFIGRHIVLNLRELLNSEHKEMDAERLEQLWLEAKNNGVADSGVELTGTDDLGVLKVPGQDPWTIVGAARVTAVRKLLTAQRRGEIGVRTGELFKHTGSNSPQAAFGKDWDEIIKDRYIYQPKPRFWALKVAST